jgi:hypothetical protein
VGIRRKPDFDRLRLYQPFRARPNGWTAVHGKSTRRPAFLGASASLKIMASAVLFERHPLDRTPLTSFRSRRLRSSHSAEWRDARHSPGGPRRGARPPPTALGRPGLQGAASALRSSAVPFAMRKNLMRPGVCCHSTVKQYSILLELPAGRAEALQVNGSDCACGRQILSKRYSGADSLCVGRLHHCGTRRNPRRTS